MKFLQYQYHSHNQSVVLNLQGLAKLVFALSFLLFSSKAAAQEISIKGNVKDDAGKGLPNVSVSYTYGKGKGKATSIGLEGKFILHIQGLTSSDEFDKNQIQVSRSKYTLKEVIFTKENKDLQIVMMEATENAGLVLDEKGTPMSGATVIFKSGKYEEKVNSNSKGIFTIHIPKDIEVSSASNFKVNDISTNSKDINVENLGKDAKKVTLTYRIPKKETPQTATENTNLASSKGVLSYTIMLDGKSSVVPNLELTIDKISYTTDAKGQIRLKSPIKTYIEPSINDYIVMSHTVDGVNAMVHIKKEGADEIIKNANTYTTSFISISDELKRTKDLLNQKNVRIRAEIANIEEKLVGDNTLRPEQRKQYTDVLEKLKETLAKSEAAYNQLQEQSSEVLLQMQVLVSSKQDSLNALKELTLLLREKNQKIEEERALEAASFRNKIILFSIIALVFAFAAVYLFILSRKLEKQKQELAETLRQVQHQKSQIEAQNTQLQAQKEEIELKNIRLEDLDREKNSLMNIVAHDLKAPLNKVVGAAQLLPNLGELNEDQTEFVGMIKKVAFEGKKFIEDLLDINAIEQQKPEAIHWEKIPLKSFISSAIIGYKQQADGKKIELHFNAQLDGTEIDADRSYLNRIIDNLVSNAIKFSPQEKNIFITATENNQNVSISIKDEGPGISPEDQKKMFKKFQKLSARPTAGESSTGLGLSIIKTLVERLNGEISVSSQLGQGTEFTVVLPKERNISN